MLPTLRLWLARKLCPSTHRVEPRDPGSFVDRVCRTTSAAERDRQEKMLTEAEARMIVVFDGFPPDPAWVEAWHGRDR